MAIAVKLQSPTGTLYDLTTGQHGFITVGLPDQNKQLEQDFGQITSGEQAVTFRNDDGWFDTNWPLPLDPEQHFLEATGMGCWTLFLYKNGAVSWVGDLDVRPTEFDPKVKTVSANFLGKVKRLEFFNADKVRRPIPQLYDGGTGTGSLNSFAATTTANYAANDLINHVLVDSASNGFAITANAATVAGVTVLTIVGTPASGTYNIRPFGLKWVSATGGGYSRRLLDSLVDISTLQLVPGDVIKITKAKNNGKILQQELEIQDTHTTDATLPTNRLRFKRRLKSQYDYTAATACTTPYYRNLSPATLAGLIYDHCGIDAGHREINITAFSTSNLVPYFNTNGKNCAEALCELAVITGATHFATPTKYYFLSLDQSKAGVTPKTIDTLVQEEKWQGLWEKFYNFITAKGSKDGQYARIGGLVYPENKLELSTDYVDSIAWLQQIAQRAYDMWGIRRKPGALTLKDDGTIYEIWDEVIRSGVTYRVIGVQEPMRSVDSSTLSTVTLTVIAKVGTAATTGVGQTQDEAVDDSDPPPPTDLEVYKVDGTEPAMFRTLYPASTYKDHCKSAPVLISAGPPIQFASYQRRLQCVRFRWDQDDLQGRLFAFHLKKWHDGADPDKLHGRDNWEDPQEATDGWYYWPPQAVDEDGGGPTYNRVGAKSWYAIQAVLEDGRMSAFCDEVPTGTESGDGDPDTPTAPTFTSVASPVDDIASTPKKECTAIVTVGITASTSKQRVRVYITDTTTGKQFSQAVKAAYADTSAVVTFRRMFRKDDACHIDRIEVENNGQSAVLDLTAPTGNFTAGSTAALSVTATATPKSGPPTLAVVFGSTPSGGTPGYTYDWDYGDGSTPHGTTQNPSHNYTAEGTFLGIVTVSDSAGQVAQATVPIQTYVGGIAGVPVPVLTADTTHGAPTLAVTFTRAASGGTAPYAGNVDYGDGTTPLAFTGWNGASTALSAHNYTTAGTRTAILTVTDAAGVTAKIELAIFVGVPVTPSGFAIAAGAMTSAVVKIPGSTAARCDALCAFTVVNCLSAIATLSDGTKTHRATAECSGGSGTFYWPAHFKRGLTLTITSVELINGQSRATVSTPANGTCTAGASAAPTPGVVTVGTVETKRRANLYPLAFTGDVTLTWCEVWKGASGATGDPDSNPTAWKAKEPIKLFTRDASGDPVCNMTTAEARVGHAQDATVDVQFRLENVYGIKGAFVKSTGAAPGTSDDTVPVISSVTPVFTADDIPGTPGKEYDGYITVAWGAVTGAAALRVHVQVDIGSGKKRNKTVEVAGTDTSCEVVFNRKFKRGQAATVKAKVVNGTADSGWSNAASNPYTVGGSATNPAAPSSITITDRKKHKTEGLISWSSDTTLRKIELWKKLHAAADATTPADTSNTWTFIKRIDIHSLVVAGGLSTPYSFQHQQDLDFDVAVRLIDCYGGHDGLTGSNWATVRTGGSAGDGGNPMNGSPWTFAGSASWDTGNKWINVGGAGAGSARLDVPLHKVKVSADLNIYLGSAAIDQTFGFLDDSGFNGYVFRLVSTTSGQLYKVDGSGTETAVGAAVTFPALVLATQTAFRMEIHQNKVIVVLGAASTRFAWSDTSYRTSGWKFWCKTASAVGRYVLISAMTIDNAGKFYEGLAIASLQLITNASNHLDARAADVTDGTNFETLNNFFEYRDSAMHLRGAKLTGPKLTAVASLPDLAGVEVGDFRIMKVTSGSERLYVCGAKDDGSKQWWKILVDTTSDTGTGGGATVPSGDIGMACFLLDSELPTPSGFALLGDLMVGDEILAPDPLTGEEVVTTVTDIKRHAVPYHILLGGFLGATEEHLLFRWGGGRPPCDCTRCTVGGLELGAMLWSRGGAPYALASKEVISGEVEVASIETGTRTYWIGKSGQYILAHNMKSLDI